MTTDVKPHETSLAVWAVPDAVSAGERFTAIVGVKSSVGCMLAGQRIVVCDNAVAALASSRLGGVPWPGTDALYWTEVELLAPSVPGHMRLTAQFDPADLDEPHQGASLPFAVTVVAAAEHVLTVTVASGETPVEDAYVRLGPYRAVTDAAGRAAVKLAAGRYQLQVWKAGYDIPDQSLDVAADATVGVEALPQPEPDPDAVWRG